MTDELELKLRSVESAIDFFRRHLISSQALRAILIDLYNFLENEEADKRLSKDEKEDKGTK